VLRSIRRNTPSPSSSAGHRSGYDAVPLYQFYPGTCPIFKSALTTGELRRSDLDFGLKPLGLDRLILADKVAFVLDMQFVRPSVN
jgi:hypothetical protein